MTASAQFQISVNGGAYAAPGVAVDAPPSATVACRIVSMSGVDPASILWTNFGTHAPSQAQLVPALSGSPLGQIATFTLPATATGQAYGIQCTVNGGYGVTGIAGTTVTSAAYCLNAAGVRPVFIGELWEASSTHGVVDRINSALAWAWATAGGIITTALVQFSNALTDPTIGVQQCANDVAGINLILRAGKAGNAVGAVGKAGGSFRGYGGEGADGTAVLVAGNGSSTSLYGGKGGVNNGGGGGAGGAVYMSGGAATGAATNGTVNIGTLSSANTKTSAINIGNTNENPTIVLAGPATLAQFTKAVLIGGTPSASVAGRICWCTNDVGGACLAVSGGGGPGDWHKVQLGAVVS